MENLVFVELLLDLVLEGSSVSLIALIGILQQILSMLYQNTEFHSLPFTNSAIFKEGSLFWPSLQ